MVPVHGDGSRISLRARSRWCFLAFELPPCGSLLLWLSQKPGSPSVAKEESETILPPTGPVQVRRVDPNVLTLDFLDLTVGDQTRPSLYCYKATQQVFQHYGWPKNPWDHAVQFQDEIIRRKFPADSGFTARYHFRIKDAVPEGLAVVVERPDLYRVDCNGRKLNAAPGEWWLDRAFGRMDLSDVAQVGDNTLTLHATPMSVLHEIEAVYVVGDFSLEATDSGFCIAPARTLALGPVERTGASTVRSYDGLYHVV